MKDKEILYGHIEAPENEIQELTSKLHTAVGKKVLVITKINFRYYGELKEVGEHYITIADEKSKRNKLILIKKIEEFEYD